MREAIISEKDVEEESEAPNSSLPTFLSGQGHEDSGRRSLNCRSVMRSALHPFSGLVHSAGELLHTPLRISTNEHGPAVKMKQHPLGYLMSVQLSTLAQVRPTF